MRIHLIFLGAIALASCNSEGPVTDAYGNFQAKEIIVSAEANGRLLAFEVDLGDRLESGERVGLIDTSQLHYNLKQLQARKTAIQSKVRSIESQLDVLQAEKQTVLTELNRLEKLLNDGAATKAQMDNVEGKLEVIQARMKSVKVDKQAVYAETEAINAQVLQVKDQLEKARIMNPTGGTVLEKYVEEGEMTTMGKPLYKLANLETMELKAYISGTQLDNVSIGQQVKVLIDKTEEGYHEFDGTVAWISPDAEFTPKIIQTKEMRTDLVYALKVNVPNDGKIKIGMPGEVRFQ